MKTKQGSNNKTASVREAVRPYGAEFPKSGKSRLSSQGQVTIPKEIREYLDLKPGDNVYFAPREGGVLMRVKRKGIDHLFGVLAEYAGDRPLGPEEIEEAAAQGALERYQRSLREYRDESD